MSNIEKYDPNNANKNKLSVPRSFRDKIEANKQVNQKRSEQTKQIKAELAAAEAKLRSNSLDVIEESKKIALKLPERIALLCDCSSSMASLSGIKDYKNNKSKIEFLRIACENFLDRINFFDTSVMLRTFPKLTDGEAANEEDKTAVALHEEQETFGKMYKRTYVGTPLLCNHALISQGVKKLLARGDTPLGELLLSLSNHEVSQSIITRAIIISDGEVTDKVFAEQQSIGLDISSETFRQHSYQAFIEMNIPIDCVHIGTSVDGETTLQRIAKDTHGVYLKFSDAEKFSSALHYLTPGYRALLTSGHVSANELGAKEIK